MAASLRPHLPACPLPLLSSLSPIFFGSCVTTDSVKLCRLHCLASEKQHKRGQPGQGCVLCRGSCKGSSLLLSSPAVSICRIKSRLESQASALQEQREQCLVHCRESQPRRPARLSSRQSPLPHTCPAPVLLFQFVCSGAGLIPHPAPKSRVLCKAGHFFTSCETNRAGWG